MFFQQLMYKRGMTLRFFVHPIVFKLWSSCLVLSICLQKIHFQNVGKVFAEGTVSVYIFVEILTCQKQEIVLKSAFDNSENILNNKACVEI